MSRKMTRAQGKGVGKGGGRWRVVSPPHHSEVGGVGAMRSFASQLSVLLEMDEENVFGGQHTHRRWAGRREDGQASEA